VKCVCLDSLASNIPVSKIDSFSDDNDNENHEDMQVISNHEKSHGMINQNECMDVVI
jgi:hypothetical protein